MTKQTLHPLFAALISLGLVSPGPISAAPAESETAAPPAVAESALTEPNKTATDKALERREKVISEASTAIAETRKALVALENDKADEALAALETATGKLEVVLARDPELDLAPVDVSATTYDLIAEPEIVKKMIVEAEEHLEHGEVQQARSLVMQLTSEIVVQSTSIPLATYPGAIKAAVPLIDAGKNDQAAAALQAALSTLVVTTEDVIPLPKVRAEHLLQEAEALAENEERSDEDNDKLAGLIDAIRDQLKMGELLGYGPQDSFQAMHDQLDEIEGKAAAGEGGEGWFGKIKQQLTNVFQS